jgi:oral-facial-digital syndrome 1 protein
MSVAPVGNAEIKSQLYSAFSKSGIETSLKAQLRLELIQLFKKQTGLVSKPSTKSKEHSISLNALNSIIIDHLQRYNYRYSLAVFLPECGLQTPQILSREDVIHVFHLENNRIITSGTDQQSCGLLEQVFSQLDQLKVTCTDKDTQTEQTKDTLDQKLKTLDEELLLRSESERLQPARSFEERMIRFERDCEDKYSKIYDDKINRFKANEISKIRLEEARKNREQMDKWIEECEKSYAQRAEKLKQREEELLDTVRRKERVCT